MSLEETKEKIEWRKNAFKFESSYIIEDTNEMIYIHDKEVNKISECNLLHDIINPPKRAKNLNSHYSPILNVCMNTRKGRSRFKNFQIILDSVCSSTILMGRIVKKLFHEKYDVMQWHTQAGNITTNYKATVDFTLPALITMNFMAWKCHVDDSAKGGYYMILGTYLLSELGLKLEFS